MLNNFSERIRNCLRRAEEYAQKAAVQSDPRLRDDLLRLEKRWLELARSTKFAEGLNSFTKNSPDPNG